MTSFIKLGIFEREARFPELNVKQLALLLCGEYPETKLAEIPVKKREAYDIYHRQNCLRMEIRLYNSQIRSRIQYVDFVIAGNTHAR